MAQWSTKRMEMEQAAKDKRRADSLAAVFAHRAELFKRFRDGGWKIKVLNPISDDNGPINQLPDNFPLAEPHYLVTMPGTHPMRIKTIEQLLRIVKGVE